MRPKIKTDMAAFLDGYKPAVTIDSNSKYLYLFEDYPSYQYDKWNIFFFQTRKEEDEFLSKLSEIEKGTYEACRLSGLTLGYPEKSVDFFAWNNEIEKATGKLPNRDIELGMIWAGFRFSTHFDIVTHEAKWLWDTYTHPKAVENPLYLMDYEYIEVPYGDFDKLNEVCEYIRQKRGLVPTITNK